MQDRNYRRNLPHIFPEGAAIFVTWNLRGSISSAFALATRKTPGLTEGEILARIDASMDTGATGPLWLRNDEIASHVCDAIEHGAELPLLHYTLHEYVVMPNHVHVFFTPQVEMPHIMRSLKITTARFANVALGRGGQPFWQAESYAHWCRTPAEFENIRAYILRNPVKAGLAAQVGEWRWSSAHRRLAEMRG